MIAIHISVRLVHQGTDRDHHEEVNQEEVNQEEVIHGEKEMAMTGLLIVEGERLKILINHQHRHHLLEDMTTNIIPTREKDLDEKNISQILTRMKSMTAAMRTGQGMTVAIAQDHHLITKNLEKNEKVTIPKSSQRHLRNHSQYMYSFKV